MAAMKVALTGGAYQAHSVIASAQRSVNLYAEPMPEGQGEPMPAAHYPTPGTRLLGTIGSGPIRGIRQCTTGGVYVVSGDTLYSVDASAWTGTALGNLTAGLHTPVSMQDNGLDMVVVDGTANGWTVSLASNAFAAISDPTGMFTGADRVDYLDTFLILNKPATPQFYISGSLAVDFDPLDFANKEAYSDLLVTIAVAKRLLYLFGERTTEIWYDAGATDIGAGSFPFAAMQSEVFIDHGCVAKYSPAVFDNSVYWLTRGRAGQGIVMMVSGYQTKRVSTYAIEAEIAGYARIDDAQGFIYQLAGHAFYVLTFPHADKTWCCDIATGLWNEWAWIDVNGAEHRHRANCFCPVNDTPVVGDWQNGNLYALDNRVFTDQGLPIKRVRSFPHMLNDGKRVFYRQFLADFETGLAPQVGVLTTITHTPVWPPQIAQLLIPSDSVGAEQLVVTDWQRGVVYLGCLSGYRRYTTALQTQSPVLSVALGASNFLDNMAVDPLGGFLLLQRGLTNYEPVLKVDPTTFGTVASFGIAASVGSYPTAVLVSQQVVCVVCNGVSYGLMKYTVASGVVSAFRVDTMQHAGFSATVVSGSTNNRAIMCAGASGGMAASAFLTWQGSVNGFHPTLPLYAVNITAGAETYDPASWPTTNSHISSTTVGTIAASAVDPAWTNLAADSIGYDQADGNVLMQVATNDAVTAQHYIVKVNAQNAAVMWRVPIGATVRSLLELTRINGSLWLFDNGTTSYRINTLTGALTPQPLSGLTAPVNAVGYIQGDSNSSLVLFQGGFTAGTGSPLPVAGTGNFAGGWALMGGQTTTTTVQSLAVPPRNLISLRWSDDRGHSWGNPVAQAIGQAGEYLTSLQWQRLAYARDRVFELSWSVPMHTTLQGAWIDVTPAQS